MSHEATATERPQELLRVVHPPNLSGAMVLVGRMLTVGRAAMPPSGMSVPHPTLSRVHFELVGSAGGYHLRDVESRNGTWLAGRRLVANEPAGPLADGDVVRAGDVLFVYERLDGPSPISARSVVPGVSLQAKKLCAEISALARDPAPALVLGETGVGKEYVARALHEGSGRPGAWVPINCGALPRDLIESQLFGHEKGAFSGAAAATLGAFREANRGTLFLDEVGDLPLLQQVKLLRAIEEGEIMPIGRSTPERVDVRVVAATNRDLQSTDFRDDLRARLGLTQVRVPPLRRRRADIPVWCSLLWHRWHERRGLAPRPLNWTPSAMETLLGCEHPTNLRGIDRLIHHLGATDLPEVTSATVLEILGTAEPPASAALPSVPRPPVPDSATLRTAFAESRGNISALARRFGRSRRQVLRWLDAHGIGDPGDSKDPDG